MSKGEGLCPGASLSKGSLSKAGVSGKGSHFPYGNERAVGILLEYILGILIFLFSLTDINECNDNNGNCLENSNCVNILGSFTCECQRGYEMINGECTGWY